MQGHSNALCKFSATQHARILQKLCKDTPMHRAMVLNFFLHRCCNALCKPIQTYTCKCNCNALDTDTIMQCNALHLARLTLLTLQRYHTKPCKDTAMYNARILAYLCCCSGHGCCCHWRQFLSAWLAAGCGHLLRVQRQSPVPRIKT